MKARTKGLLDTPAIPSIETTISTIVLEGHDTKRSVNAVAWNPKGDLLVSCSEDETLIIWNAKTGLPVFRLEGHTGSVRFVEWIQKGERIISGTAKFYGGYQVQEIFIWDALTGKKICEVEGLEEKCVSCFKLSPKGEVAYLSYSEESEKKITIWNLSTKEPTAQLEGHSQSVKQIAWSPKGDQIVSGAMGEVMIWDATSGENLLQIKAPPKYPCSVDWSANGDQVLAGFTQDMWKSRGGSAVILVWNAATGESVAELKVKTGLGGLSSAAWSPNGQHILAVVDKVVFIWDAATGEQISELQGTRAISCAAWSPNGESIAPAAQHGALRIWRAGWARPLALAVAMALHPRLGRDSPLAALDRELVGMVVREMPPDWSGPPPVRRTARARR